MKNFKYILLLAFSSVLFSCTDIIELDLTEGDKMIIINGRVTNSVPATVEIYMTTAVFNDGPNPKINNATVLLFEDGVNVSSFTQDSQGTYQSTYVGTIGKSYNIEVIIPAGDENFGGTTWASGEDLLLATAPLDTIFQKTVEKDLPFEDGGEYVFYEFTDPAGIPNNYRFRAWQNGIYLSNPSDLSIYDDEFWDGKTFTDDESVSNRFPARRVNDTSAVNNEHWKIEQSSISNAYFDYISLLREQTASTGGIFDPPPELLEGNIYNVSSDRKALGFFDASAIETLEYIVKH